MKGNESFLTETPQVWQFGPIFASLYHDLKHHKKAVIKKQIKVFDETQNVDDGEVKSTLKAIWNKYEGKSGIYLSDITHQPVTPWRNLAKRYNFSVPCGLEIKPKDIIFRKNKLYLNLV